MSTRTVSARIDGKQHEQILEICNQEGMTVNQFLIWLIEGWHRSNIDKSGRLVVS